MNLRQSLALGVVGGIVALSGFLFYRRRDPDIISLFSRPFFPLASCCVFVMFILGITFSTPIETSELQTMFYVLSIIVGVLEISIGGIGYLFFPIKVASQLQVHPHFIFQQAIGMSYIAFGIMMCIVGAIRAEPLPLVVFIAIFCWGRVIFFLRYLFVTNVEPEKEVEGQNDATAPISGWMLEIYTSSLAPILFVSLYITAFCYE